MKDFVDELLKNKSFADVEEELKNELMDKEEDLHLAVAVFNDGGGDCVNDCQKDVNKAEEALDYLYKTKNIKSKG